MRPCRATLLIASLLPGCFSVLLDPSDLAVDGARDAGADANDAASDAADAAHDAGPDDVFSCGPKDFCATFDEGEVTYGWTMAVDAGAVVIAVETKDPFRGRSFLSAIPSAAVEEGSGYPATRKAFLEKSELTPNPVVRCSFWIRKTAPGKSDVASIDVFQLEVAPTANITSYVTKFGIEETQSNLWMREDVKSVDGGPSGLPLETSKVRAAPLDVGRWTRVTIERDFPAGTVSIAIGDEAPVVDSNQVSLTPTALSLRLGVQSKDTSEGRFQFDDLRCVEFHGSR